MNRHRVLIYLLAVYILISLACNAFAGSQSPAIQPPPTVDGNNDQQGIDQEGDLAPTATFPAANRSEATVRMLVDLNIRSGPGVQYDRIGFLLAEDQVQVIGRHEQSGWWLIECPANVENEQCWVSGGEQYTAVENGQIVTAVEAPPTPTPVPPDLDQGVGQIAFADGGFLYLLQVDINQSPPTALQEPILLDQSVSIQNIAFAPDGKRVAYSAGSSEANAIYVVNVNGEDQRRLAASDQLPLSIEQNAANFAVVIDQIGWLPDGETVIFNTRFTNLVGSGGGSQEDLWSVTLDGQLQERLPAGEGGGAFIVSPNNQIFLSRADNIARAGNAETQPEIVLEFDQINTASEYIYYPVPQIIQGNANIAIPDKEPYLIEAQTTLWQIPNQGSAVQIGSLLETSLFDPVSWSANGNRLAYVRQVSDPDAPQPTQLIVTDGKGINPEIYAAGDILRFHGWSTDNNRFLYSGNGFYTVGKMDAPPVQTLLTPNFMISDGRWITESDFVVAVGQPQNESWQIQSANSSGSMVPLGEVQGQAALFEIWTGE